MPMMGQSCPPLCLVIALVVPAACTRKLPGDSRPEDAGRAPPAEADFADQMAPMGCADLEWRATTLAEKVTRCEHDYDCCFVWDVLSDCIPANRSDTVAADLAELQDTTLRLVRECQKK